jgi:very-short-patch-repair endonuclease
MQRLLERGYRVEGQVGSIGYRIDMVVEGADRRRLAVECDGDRYHGAEQWRQDMRRQRVLERVGWRFWRCFASSFYRDPDGVMNDLFEMLTRMGIEPGGQSEAGRPNGRFTEHRTIEPPAREPAPSPEIDSENETDTAEKAAPATAVVELGDKVVVVFADDRKRISIRLSEAGNDLEKGRLSVGSPLGKAIYFAEEGDEVEFMENELQRKVLIESIEKGLAPSIARNGSTADESVVVGLTPDAERAVASG